MDFSLEQAGLDRRVLLQQLGSLFCPHPEDDDSLQLALIAERERSGNGHSVIHPLLDDSSMLRYHIHELRRQPARFDRRIAVGPLLRLTMAAPRR
jgi:hypothetical protein